jgi:acyl-CoA reductase-like NAD-dependent aldehyde dehydrogenase
MQKALLLVDLQHDFLNRPGLLPQFKDIVGPIADVLAHARAKGMPVAHVRTWVKTSGEDRMPHWQQGDIWECVAGSAGVQAPQEFAALEGERVFYKQFFSGFGNSGLDDWLRVTDIGELWIAGVYTHGCVRATVMDAYERGYRVTVVDDGIASIDPLHARITRDYLNGRAAHFATSGKLLGAGPVEDVHCNPDHPELEVARVQRSTATDILGAVETARRAGEQWCREPTLSRRDIFRRFADRLRSAESQLVKWMIRDLGKPRRDAIDELRRAQGHLAAALALEEQEAIDSGATVFYQPHGVVAVITPWNNPLAIPIGKLAAALLLGNSVVWKPAFQADTISQSLLSLLHDCGLPDGLVQLVNGGAGEVAELVGHQDVAAVSLTGPEQAGMAVAAICRQSGKPLQAELGGNNALLVMADADLPQQAATWARLAFGFAGQRCTAVRRFVVEQTVVERFESLLVSAVRKLQLEEPSLASCDVGPLISAAQLDRVRAAVDSALERGARLLVGGESAITTAGHYYLPTLLADLAPDDPLVQEELFGPVAIVQVAEDFEQGLTLVNGVRQGLLAGIATTSAARYETFAEWAEVGIVIDAQGMRIHPAAPFGGRKASQIGPPEHGVWDRQFFSRVQVRYRSEF